MELSLRFFASFREAVGEKERTRTYDGDATTVGTVLGDLESEYEGLAGELLADESVRDQLSVLKNGQDVVHMAGVDTELHDADTLSVFPPVAGG
jgi:molybdopterin synthase sulfur carrier subunit